eukprot:TRINITY_DN45480_c0_g1_i1.p1 TRINITY_DN45480_c0_g1~~TRINITY_DN45480_c0_g1_i1.p1  ORF type:complete len:635 (+),score=83.24 TRINITY_DN45480_c0_g1_i1:73-1977(+)
MASGDTWDAWGQWDSYSAKEHADSWKGCSGGDDPWATYASSQRAWNSSAADTAAGGWDSGGVGVSSGNDWADSTREWSTMQDTVKNSQQCNEESSGDRVASSTEWGDGTWGSGKTWAEPESDWAGFGADLDTKIDWQNVKLQRIKKDFYFEHPDIKNLTTEEVERIRKELDIEILGGYSDAANPISSFLTAGFPQDLVNELHRQLRRQGSEATPTPIQRQVWPVALSGHDLIGIAETGSGKTLAYILPMLLHIQAQPELRPGEGPIGVVLCPFRELAHQIDHEVKCYVGGSGIRSVCVFGGGPYREQADALGEKNDIIVATPGRFIHLLNDRVTNLNRVTYLVLDEADEMLAQGFEEQVNLVMSQVRPDRQILMFSATWNDPVHQLAKNHCKTDPVFIRVGGDKLAACRNIQQTVEILRGETATPDGKFKRLLECIESTQCGRKGNENKCLVFCKTKATVDDLHWRLDSERHISFVTLHGGKNQAERSENLASFKDPCGPSILVSTGVMGRGHDIPMVKFVINYDYPGKIEDYIHRVGRTGRAGQEGIATTFLTDREQDAAADLVSVMHQTNQTVSEDLANLARGGAETDFDDWNNWKGGSADWQQDQWQAGWNDHPAHGSSSSQTWNERDAWQ